MDILGKCNSSWFLISKPDVESFIFHFVFSEVIASTSYYRIEASPERETTSWKSDCSRKRKEIGGTGGKKKNSEKKGRKRYKLYPTRVLQIWITN